MNTSALHPLQCAGSGPGFCSSFPRLATFRSVIPSSCQYIKGIVGDKSRDVTKLHPIDAEKTKHSTKEHLQ